MKRVIFFVVHFFTCMSLVCCELRINSEMKFKQNKTLSHTLIDSSNRTTHALLELLDSMNIKHG